MVTERSKAVSRSRSLAADSEDRGLGGGRWFGWCTDTPLSLLPSSMCNSRAAGKENRGEGQPDRPSKGGTPGVTEGETGG